MYPAASIIILYACVGILSASQMEKYSRKKLKIENTDEQFFNLGKQEHEIGKPSREESGKTNHEHDDKNEYSTSDSTPRQTVKASNNVEQQCPEGFSFYKHFLGTPFCYYLTEPQPFPPVCPYQNYLEYDAIRQITEQFYNISMWIKAKRNDYNGFGEFEWLYPSHRYMDVIREYENPIDNIMERKCLVRIPDQTRKSGKLVPTFCDEKFPVLCVYSYSHKVIGKYCSKRNSFTPCISTTLNLDNKCYCQAHVEGMLAGRSAFCHKLAEPIDRFQNHMLLTELTNRSPCWFGVERNVNGDFHWSSLNHTLDYTYWKENVDASKPYGALDYTKPKGWILEDDYALKCAICETEVPYQNVTMRLVHIPNQNKLELRIQNFFDIHSYFILQYVVACFTDANVDGLTTKILNLVSDIISIERENFTKTMSIENYYPSYFWCETFQRPNLTRIVSNTILVYQDIGKHAHEYAVTVTVPVTAGVDPYLKNLHVKVTKFINDTLCKETNITNSVRPMRVLELSQKDEYMILLLHMSVAKSNFSSEEEYHTILEVLERLPKRPFSIVSGIVNLSRSEVCLPNTTISGGVTLHWPETKIGTTTLPMELCLLENSSPVTRKCEGDFSFGGVWGEVQGECYINVNISERTIVLYDLLNSNQSSTELGKNLCDVTKCNEDVLVIDVHFMAEILEKLSKFDDGNITEIAYSLSNIMEFEEEVLKKSQIQLNSTDRMLHALDKISAKVGLNENKDYVTVRSKRLILQISDLKTSNVTGLAIQKFEFNYRKYEAFIAKPLYNNVSLEELLQEDLEVAIFLPQEHIEEIKKCMEKEEDIKLAIAFFSKNVLFNEVEESDIQDNSRIISVFIPGLTCTFENPIVMIFHPLEDGDKLNCGHWNYGNDEKMESINGRWKTDHFPEIITNESKYAICNISHTTHYALLMFSDNYWTDISQEDVLALNIITAVGCGLSLLGLAGIFITAIAFKSWRNRARNIIMLNFSLSLAAQMILLFISDSAIEDSLSCRITGASLHYSVLSEFAWMLIVAILQYRKFVLVFQKPIRYLILKCLIVGWLLPLLPVVLQFAFFPSSYEQNVWGLCYPDGNYFYFGVALPVSVIVLINLFVFIKILVNICHKKVEAYGPKDNDMKLQVLLAILLFFLLGMSWIFGLAAAFLGWLMFSYLFCLTATLQGFVIFVFFVVMNEKSRLLWLNIKKICFCTDMRKRIH